MEEMLQPEDWSIKMVVLNVLVDLDFFESHRSEYGLNPCAVVELVGRREDVLV